MHYERFYKQASYFFNMLRDIEEYKFPYLERGRLISMLNRAGFELRRNSHGWHVYVTKPKKGDAKIENHYLPVAFLTVNSYRPLSPGDPLLKEYHEEIKKIYHKIVD